MSGALAGLKVVELANVISGPYTGMLLADLGADVLKVEMPGTGDVFRLWDGQPGRVRPQFAAYNRGKRSVTVDIRKPGGQEVLRRLVAGADVLLENFRPGFMDRLGVGYEALSALNPRLVYCAISGMGPAGPYRDRPTYDAIAQAISGLWSQFTDMDDPEPVGPPLCDQLTGLYAAFAIVAALNARSASGGGQKVEVSMLGAGMAFQTVPIADYSIDGKLSDKMSRPRRSQSYAFVAGDGLPLAIHLSTPQKFWEGLCNAVGHPELVQDPRFRDKLDRIRHYDQLRAVLAEVFRTRPRAEWLAALEQHDVPAAPINGVAEAVADPQVQFSRLVRRFGSGERSYNLVGFPFEFSRTPCEPGLPPPDAGEHAGEVLRAVGFTEEEVSALRQEGAI